METVEAPQRRAVRMDEERLVRLERHPLREDKPTLLNLSDILVLDALFQPRGFSLTMNPGASRKHVLDMARAVSRGATLDPIVIAAFGAQWVLLDGHHRRAAYNEANYSKPVPVTVEDCPARHSERIRWAVLLSIRLNSKNKLAMSREDKFDAAWRLVVETGEALSKKDLVHCTGVADGTIGNMRRVSVALTKAGKHPFALRTSSWPSARYQYRSLKGDTDEGDPSGEERRLRLLTRNLTPIVNGRLSAMLLLKALEGLRPGISLELETAIAEAKQLEAVEDGDAGDGDAGSQSLEI